MVKNTRTKYTDILNEGTFMGIVAPEFEHFKITLTEHVRTGTKGTEEVSKDHNFNLRIKSDISKAYKEKLDNELKNAFKMNWAPYDYHTKEYHYYTSKYIPENDKVERLKATFQALKDFEVYYKEAVQESIELFNKDAIDKRSYLDHEVAVKFNEDKNCFVVVALRFLGEGKYPLLANAAMKKGVISSTTYKESGFFDEFINWDKQKKDLYYFEINPESYLEIRNFIEVKEKAKEIFQEKQLEILDTIGKDNIAHFEEENIFDLKVTYNEQLKMFEFYCKGYSEPQVYGNQVADRTLISFLAVNYLLSKDLTDKEIEENFERLENGEYTKNNFIADRDLEFFDSKKYKYNLKFEEESTKREKKLYLSLEYNDILKEIISNYEKNKDFFSRKVREIKIKNQNSVNASSYLNKKYPSIYLHDDGRCFYVLATRETYEMLPGKVLKTEVNEQGESVATRVSKGRSASFTMKAIEITHAEALDYLYENPWKEHIESNSIYLNTELWMTNENKPQLNAQDRKKSFDILLLNNKLQGEAKKENAQKSKVKKLKI